MKYGQALLIVVFAIVICNAGNNMLMNDNIRISPLLSSIADQSQFNVSAGFFNAMNRNYTYSSMNAGFAKTFNEHWTLTYDVGYTTFNMQRDFLRGGLGLRYHNDNFSMSIYLNRSFETEPLINNNFGNLTNF